MQNYAPVIFTILSLLLLNCFRGQDVRFFCYVSLYLADFNKILEVFSNFCDEHYISYIPANNLRSFLVLELSGSSTIILHLRDAPIQ
jgi:hypothetical protein